MTAKETDINKRTRGGQPGNQNRRKHPGESESKHAQILRSGRAQYRALKAKTHYPALKDLKYKYRLERWSNLQVLLEDMGSWITNASGEAMKGGDMPPSHYLNDYLRAESLIQAIEAVLFNDSSEQAPGAVTPLQAWAQGQTGQ